MSFLDQLIIPPSKDYLELLRYLLVLTSLIHFPFVGMVIVATKLSLLYNYRDSDIPNSTFARMAKDLMDMVLPNRYSGLIFGVLPLLAMCMLYAQWLFKSDPPSYWLLPLGTLLVALSFGPLTFYKYALRREGQNSPVSRMVGAMGLGGLLLGTYLVITATTRFIDPERWHLEQNIIRQMLSFNVIWRYNMFLMAGAAITGGGLLFFLFTWAGHRHVKDEEYGKYVKNFGAGLSIVGIFGVPVMYLFYMVTTPHLAKSGEYFLVACAVTAVLFICFALIYNNFVSNRARFGGSAFVLFLLVFLLLGVGDQITLVNATKERTAALITDWEEREARRELDRASHMEVKVDIARGEEVFQTICSTCHRMDEKLVGPPLNAVLPKYENADALAAFVSNPVKVNPEYPPMPNPGLSLADVKSVAAYLKGEEPGEGSDQSGNGGEHGEDTGGH